MPAHTGIPNLIRGRIATDEETLRSGGLTFKWWNKDTVGLIYGNEILLLWRGLAVGCGLLSRLLAVPGGRFSSLLQRGSCLFLGVGADRYKCWKHKLRLVRDLGEESEPAIFHLPQKVGIDSHGRTRGCLRRQ